MKLISRKKEKFREMVSSTSESATVAMATPEPASYHGFNHYFGLITKRPAVKTAYGASKRKMSMPVRQCVRIISSSSNTIIPTTKDLEEDNNDINYVLEDQQPMDLTSKKVAEYNHPHTIHPHPHQTSTKATIVLSVPNVDLRSTTAATTTTLTTTTTTDTNVIKTENAKNNTISAPISTSAGSNQGRSSATQ